jgi:NitT/TauT family transport system permease protein
VSSSLGNRLGAWHAARKRRGLKPAARGSDALVVWIGRIVLIAIFFTGWQLASGSLLPKFWVSDPVSILGRLLSWSADGSLWRHLGTTLITMCLGYVIGASSGALLGLLLGLFPTADEIFGPYIMALYGLPKIALAPLLVILLGIGIASKVALVALVVVFLVLYTTLDGVRDVDRDLVDMLKLMGANGIEQLVKIVLPSTIPWIYTGLRLSVSYAFTTTVIGEVLSSNRGIGYLITSSAARYDPTGVFAAVTVLVVVSVGITQTLSKIEGRKEYRH